MSCYLLFDHFQFTFTNGPNILGSYAILLFTASDFTSITSNIHNWVVFLVWLHLFILSGVISPLIPSNILGPYLPGKFIFQCPIFLPFHTVHGVLKARILKWFAIPSPLDYILSEFSTTRKDVFVIMQICAHTDTYELFLALCDPMNYNPPGSSVHGVFQARILQLVAISYYRGSS